MKPLLPFIYQHRLNELRYSLGKTIVMAASGMGKSTFIRRLNSSLIEDGKSPTFVKPRLTSQDCGKHCDQIIQWCENIDNLPPNEKYLLIDDLDFFYTIDLEQQFFDISANQDIVIVATSTVPTRTEFLGGDLRYGLNEKRIETDPLPGRNKIINSRGLSSFYPMWLMPWDGPRSEDRLLDTINKALEEQIDYLKNTPSIEYATNIIAFLKAHLDDFDHRLLDLSGGHPALLDYCLNKFLRQINHRFKENNGDLSRDFIEIEFEELKISLIENYTARIHNAIQWAEQLLPTSIFLRSLEQVSKEQDISDSNGYMVLHKAGLIKKQDDKVVFVCDTIQKIAENRLKVLSEKYTNLSDTVYSKKSQSEKKIRCQLKPQSSGKKGVMICQIEGQSDKVIEFSPNEWAIIAKLAEHRGELVNVEALGSDEKETMASIRSALQRLMAKLRQEGLEGVVTNVARKGYLYNPEIS